MSTWLKSYTDVLLLWGKCISNDHHIKERERERWPRNENMRRYKRKLLRNSDTMIIALILVQTDREHTPDCCINVRQI